MKTKNFLILVLVCFAVSLIGSTSLFAQEKMKYEDYQLQLAEWRDREVKANQEIERLQSEIDALKRQISDVERQINDTMAQIWRELGTTEQGFRNYINQLERLRDQVRGLLNLSPGDLFKRRDEAESAQQRFDELKSSRSAKHPDAAQIISELQRLMDRLAQALKDAGPPFDMYTVVKGDYLFKISGKRDIYNDPYQWLKIWTKNRELIKDPDLIYPDWSLKIPRGVGDNEHLVVKGENLSKIAGYSNVYNDPFKWTKLYDANKDVIKDPNVIYPHMIIIKP